MLEKTANKFLKKSFIERLLQAMKTGVGSGAGMDNIFTSSMVGGGFGGTGVGGGFPVAASMNSGLTNIQNRVLDFIRVKYQYFCNIHLSTKNFFLNAALENPEKSKGGWDTHSGSCEIYGSQSV